MNKYLLTIRSSLVGPQVHCWHEIDSANDSETKTVLFGMTISSKMNMASGVLLLNSEDEWTAEDVELYIRSLSHEDLTKFIAEASLAAKKDELA